MKLNQLPWKDYIYQWDAHIGTFWVPLAVCIIFLVLTVQAIQNKQVLLSVLYVILALGCISYIGFGDQLLEAVTKLW